MKPVSWAIYKSSVEFIRKGRVLVCWQPVWPRVASHRGTWSQGCYQSGKTCQCYWGLDLWEYCWLSASGSHAVRCKVRLVHLIPWQHWLLALTLWQGKDSWAVLAACFLSRVKDQCFSAYLELIFALEVVQEVLVMGVTHLAEQWEKAGHILALGTNPKNT